MRRKPAGGAQDASEDRPGNEAEDHVEDGVGGPEHRVVGEPFEDRLEERTDHATDDGDAHATPAVAPHRQRDLHAEALQHPGDQGHGGPLAPQQHLDGSCQQLGEQGRTGFAHDEPGDGTGEQPQPHEEAFGGLVEQPQR